MPKNEDVSILIKLHFGVKMFHDFSEMSRNSRRRGFVVQEACEVPPTGLLPECLGYELFPTCQHLLGSRKDQATKVTPPRTGDCSWILRDVLPKSQRVERPRIAGVR